MNTITKAEKNSCQLNLPNIVFRFSHPLLELAASKKISKD